MSKKKSATLSPKLKSIVERLGGRGKNLDPKLVKESISQMLNFGVKAS